MSNASNASSPNTLCQKAPHTVGTGASVETCAAASNAGGADCCKPSCVTFPPNSLLCPFPLMQDLPSTEYAPAQQAPPQQLVHLQRTQGICPVDLQTHFNMVVLRSHATFSACLKEVGRAPWTGLLTSHSHKSRLVQYIALGRHEKISIRHLIHPSLYFDPGSMLH